MFTDVISEPSSSLTDDLKNAGLGREAVYVDLLINDGIFLSIPSAIPSFLFRILLIQIRQLLRACGSFRKFIPNFSKVTADSLTSLKILEKSSIKSL